MLIAGVPHWEGSAQILASPWEVSSALKLLFDNQSVRGDVLHDDELPTADGMPNLGGMSFQGEGFDPGGGAELVSYDHLVLYQFSRGPEVSLQTSPPIWAPEELALRTHENVVGSIQVDPAIRQIVQSPYRWNTLWSNKRTVVVPR